MEARTQRVEEGAGGYCAACGCPREHLDVYYESPMWSVLRCPECTYAWVVDRKRPFGSAAFDWDRDIVSESGKRTPMYRDRLGRIEQLAPTPKSWLDVGCGGGGMLRLLAQAGWSAEGIELSDSADTIARDFGIAVHRHPLPEALPLLASHTYGVVSYFHVFEHVFTPQAELAAVRECLSPTGILALEVPHFGTLSWRVLGPRHRHFYQLHRSYFNVRSLSEMLRKSGYTVVSWEKVPYLMSIGWLLRRLKLKSLARRCPQRFLDHPLRIDLGDMLLVLARLV